MSVTAACSVPGLTTETRNARLAEMETLLAERRAAADRLIARLDDEAAAEGKPGFASWVRTGERIAQARGDDPASARQLMVTEAGEHARWCATCGGDLVPGAGVVRRRVFLGYGIGGGNRWTVAPVCGPWADWWHWDGLATCVTCGRPVVDLARTARRHWRPACCAACARAAANAERRVQHQERACSTCRAGFTPSRADTSHCSSACRQRAYRLRRAEAQPGLSSRGRGVER